jgi:hypothetical protein
MQFSIGQAGLLLIRWSPVPGDAKNSLDNGVKLIICHMIILSKCVRNRSRICRKSYQKPQ